MGLISRLEDRKLFAPYRVKPDHVDDMVKELASKLKLDPSQSQALQEAVGQAEDHHGRAAVGHNPQDRDADLYFYGSKFPFQITEKLITFGVLRKGESGYRAVERGAAATLLSIAVNHAKAPDSDDVKLIREAATTSQLRLASTAATGEVAQYGIEVGLSLPTIATSERALDRLAELIIDLRHDDKTEQARCSFLREIEEFRAKETPNGRPASRATMERRLREHMDLASRSFVRRLGVRGVGCVVLGTFSAVLALSQDAPNVVAVASAALSTAGTLMGVPMSPMGNAYLRAIQKHHLVTMPTTA